MVLGTINLIQAWDLAQFQALDPLRREALLRALNEDATKLIAEVGESDREMRQLRDKLNECNQHFQNLTAAVTEEGIKKLCDTVALFKCLEKQINFYQLTKCQTLFPGTWSFDPACSIY